LAISKEKKQKMVADYVQRLSKSQAIILTDYRGMTVASVTELRTRLREVNGGFQVVKNTLFERALAESGIPVYADAVTGPIAVGYCYSDVPQVVKTLNAFARATDALSIRGAFFGKAFLDAAGAKALADLPPREVVLGGLLGMVQGPMISLVSTIAAPMRELTQVLQARSEQAAA